ncbi:hypothetical protein PRIPAC_74395 [Pristionchus pacificus]|uniref:W02B3.4-like N-terminal domain-containing protein n=2 Tax=Pristionchus pacificus TaxID=54126 RepID=A0A2A6CF13_PRIPA|nr:hypothetical protein PRIPAC_74395 [Pristionchus pacificus]|eukprot:PDM76677.1 hypothetical protein PRIPAC_42072 [Pristionchus pacificus]
MKSFTKSFFFVSAILFFIIMVLYIRQQYSLDKYISFASSNCFQSIATLPPLLTHQGDVIDVYLIDIDAIEILQRNCRSAPKFPISVMIAHSDETIRMNHKIYNVSVYVDKGDYVYLPNEEKAFKKQDHHKIGPILVPFDLGKFKKIHERSRLISCLNINMNRTNAKQHLPQNFEVKLAELRDALMNMDAMPFLAGGTLLGWYRECAIIPHTYDADFGVLKTDLKSNMFEQLKALSGFKLSRRLGRNFDSLEFTVTATGGGSIDIFIVYDEVDDDRVYTAGLDNVKGRRFKWIIPRAKGYCSGILGGRLFYVPCNVEETLRPNMADEWAVDEVNEAVDVAPAFELKSDLPEVKLFGKWNHQEAMLLLCTGAREVAFRNIKSAWPTS